MASTREVVTYILKNDQETRDWFENHHSFTLAKAEKADLRIYRDLVSVLINEGVRRNVVTQAQADGRESL